MKKNIYQKLMDARIELLGTKLNKSGENKFAKYKYFELGDFLNPIQRILAENKLCSLVWFTSETATLTLIDIENPTEQITLTSPMGSAALKGCHEVQNIGAVETYQRRYLYMTLFEIVEHDALDSSNPKDIPKKERPAPTPKPPAKKDAERIATYVVEIDKVPGLTELEVWYKENTGRLCKESNDVVNGVNRYVNQIKEVFSK